MRTHTAATGGWRRDEAHMAVVDGLITEQERAEILDWLTEPGGRLALPVLLNCLSACLSVSLSVCLCLSVCLWVGASLS